MTTHADHLQAILDAATAAATASPTSANISAVEKARRAVDDFAQSQAAEAGGERFKTQAAALEYLQRTWKIEKSKLSKDVQGGKVPRKDGLYHARDLDYYANASRLDTKNSEIATPGEAKDRLTMAMAQERELKLASLRGELISLAEEEARDAKLWAAIKSDIENQATAIVHELMNRVIVVVPDDDLRQRILALGHELRLVYEDAIADIFDRYAKDGGIEA